MHLPLRRRPHLGPFQEQPSIRQQPQDENLSHHRHRSHDPGCDHQGIQLHLLQEATRLLLRIHPTIHILVFVVWLYGLFDRVQMAEILALEDMGAVDHIHDDEYRVEAWLDGKCYLLYDSRQSPMVPATCGASVATPHRTCYK